jgi:ABC-type dipeptide/oligopeptide/nickel transport system permease subunit
MVEKKINTRFKRQGSSEERYYLASQSQLIWRKFKKHKLALISSGLLVVLYVVAIFAPFIAPYSANEKDSKLLNVPPQRVRFFGEEGFRPFVYGYTRTNDPKTLKFIFTRRVHPTNSLVSSLPACIFLVFLKVVSFSSGPIR